MKIARFFLLCSVLFFSTGLMAQKAMPAKKQGVYEFVAQKIQGDFDEVATAISEAVQQNGWDVVAVVDAGTPEGCEYRARVFVLYDSTYAETLLQANRRTAPYALLDRVTLFEDENGLNLSIVNTVSINRTVMMDDEKFDALSAEHKEALRTALSSAVTGESSDRQYGQVRKKGYIGKTMGVMAGGKFSDQLEDIMTISGGSLDGTVGQVRSAFQGTGATWGIHMAYEVPLPAHNMTLFGVTGTPMDSKSFSIVGAGADKMRKNFKCPGIAHAAAYPIEVVVAQNGDDVVVTVPYVMYRMKMYFEDAGKWAFMKNMTMPGSIQDEITEMVKTAVAGK